MDIRLLRIFGLFAVGLVATLPLCWGASIHRPPPHHPVPIYTGADGKPLIYVQSAGAVCNSSHDDTAAINGAEATLQSLGGGTLQFGPASGYCCVPSGGVTTSGPAAIRFVGDSPTNAALSACGADVATLTLNSGRSSVEHMTVVGKGTATDTYSMTQPAVHFGPGCNSCVSDGTAVIFGTGFLDKGSDSIIKGTNVSYSYGAQIFEVEIGIHMSGGHNSLDQGPPFVLPPVPFSVAPWAPFTFYPTGTIVSLPGGQRLQAGTAGMSGAISPSPRPYFVNISDGTVSWQLFAPNAAYSALHFGCGSDETNVDDIDLSGTYAGQAISVSVPSGCAGPTHLNISNVVAGGALTNEVLVLNGSDFKLSQSEIGGCYLAGCSEIETAVNFAGPASFDNVTVWSPEIIHFYFVTGDDIEVVNSHAYGASFAAIYTAPGLNRFTITNNDFGASSIYGTNNNAVVVGTGPSNDYIVNNNNCAGLPACLIDGGTGTNKITAPNIWP